MQHYSKVHPELICLGFFNGSRECNSFALLHPHFSVEWSEVHFVQTSPRSLEAAHQPHLQSCLSTSCLNCWQCQPLSKLLFAHPHLTTPMSLEEQSRRGADWQSEALSSGREQSHRRCLLTQFCVKKQQWTIAALVRSYLHLGKYDYSIKQKSVK